MLPGREWLLGRTQISVLGVGTYYQSLIDTPEVGGWLQFKTTAILPKNASE